MGRRQRPTAKQVADRYGVKLDEIGPDTPLRLDLAAALAYPDGSIGADTLRREQERGTLVGEYFAGRYYTTLSDIKRMREQCRYVPKKVDSPAKTRSSGVR